jgi:hypothetical protein
VASNGRGFDPGTRAILEELRDLRVEMGNDRRRSDERFERMFQKSSDESARRDATIQGMFKQIRTVGLAIVKTLNRHTRILEHNTRILESSARILERMDRKLGARDNGRPGPNGGRA